MSNHTFPEVVNKLRDQMNAIGPNYIRSLHTKIPTFGECPNRRAMRDDIRAGLFCAPINMTDEERLCMAHATFTEDPPDSLDYDKLYHELTGGLSAGKMACVQQAFERLDTACCGSISA